MTIHCNVKVLTININDLKPCDGYFMGVNQIDYVLLEYPLKAEQLRHKTELWAAIKPMLSVNCQILELNVTKV